MREQKRYPGSFLLLIVFLTNEFLPTQTIMFQTRLHKRNKRKKIISFTNGWKEKDFVLKRVHDKANLEYFDVKAKSKRRPPNGRCQKMNTSIVIGIILRKFCRRGIPVSKETSAKPVSWPSFKRGLTDSYLLWNSRAIQRFFSGCIVIDKWVKVEKRWNENGKPFVCQITTPSAEMVVGTNDEKNFHPFVFFVQSQMKLNEELTGSARFMFLSHVLFQWTEKLILSWPIRTFVHHSGPASPKVRNLLFQNNVSKCDQKTVKTSEK